MEVTTLQNSETLLIVDDEPLMTELFRQFMTKRGYKVLTAASGEDALKAMEAESGAVALVITDMSMTGMDGMETAEAIAASWPGVPVLISTGHDTEGAMETAPSNVVGFVQKPYQNKALAERIRALLDERR